MKYLSPSDRIYAKRLIDAILKRGYLISIFEGEEYIEFSKPFKTNPKFSNDAETIYPELGCTGEDWIHIVANEDGVPVRKGTFYLIYHNGDGMEVICDYSANALCDEIYNEIDD